MEELEKAHIDYETRKEQVIMNLETISINLACEDKIPEIYIDWLDRAIEFIREKEI